MDTTNDVVGIQGQDGPPESVITVGTFDGVHRGHRVVIEAVKREARRRGLRSVVVTFSPHPLKVVRPKDAPGLLTSPEEKEALLRAAGIDYVPTLEFTQELARFSPRQFVEEILIGRYGLRHLVTGYDHGFGRGRSGDVDTLREIGRDLGFDVDVVPAHNIGETPVSSSRIRRALEAGDVEGAARGLGRAYSLRGRVVRGEGRGRQLGVPTANLAIDEPDKLLPREGIYAVRARLDGRILDGVLHLGPRPTFEGASPSVELHLLDFDGDLYGTDIGVAFCARIRDILAFDTVDALIEAMRDDVDRTRSILASGGGACQEIEALIM